MWRKLIVDFLEGRILGKKIIVLGAGYAGVLIAKKLAKKIKKEKIEGAEVTIIDRNPFHTMLTELHEVAAQRVDESSIRIELSKIFAGRDVKIVMDTIVSAEYDKNKLIGKVGTYDYDYLVMASGCKPTFFGTKGAKENSFTLWSYDDAVRLRVHIMDMFRQASIETDPERKKALLTFYIVGTGFTGVEMAGELAEFAPIACEKFKLKKEDVRIFNVDVIDKIMPFLPDVARDRAMRRLAKIGVTVQLKTKIVGVNPDSIECVLGEKTYSDSTKTVIWTAGIEGSDIAMQSEALGHVPRSRGRIQTDKYLRSLTHPNVYVAGDNIFYIPEGEKDPVPQMVENCEHCAPLIAENILAEVRGKSPEREYKPHFHGAMVCIGGRYGTSYGGLPGKFFVQPSFFAMFAKHFINVVYFFQILGWNKVFSYITNEFFTIRNRRSFLGGHLFNCSPLFFTFPLRIFMGIYFVYITYVRSTPAYRWLSEPVFADMFERLANTFKGVYNIPFTSIPMDFGFFGIIRYYVYNMNNVSYMILQTSPMSWFLETFVVASPSQEMFWQTLIMIFTLLVGLAFMAGLFTTLVSFATVFYALIIMMTTGLPYYSWWLIFAPFTFMFTGGKVLSLDYYVMPWLKKKWNSIPWVKKWYLYND